MLNRAFVFVFCILLASSISSTATFSINDLPEVHNTGTYEIEKNSSFTYYNMEETIDVDIDSAIETVPTKIQSHTQESSSNHVTAVQLSFEEGLPRTQESDIKSNEDTIEIFSSSLSIEPHVEFTSSLNISTITTSSATDVTAIQYNGNLTAIGSVNVSEIPIDYVIALDASGSVGQSGWTDTINWAKSFVNSIKDIDRVSIIRFATGASNLHSLNDNQSRTYIINLLENMIYTGGWTYTRDAVLVALNEFDTNSDPSKPKFLFIVTDGIPQSAPGSPSQEPCNLENELKSRLIRTLIIGVGSAWNPNILACLVENPETDILFFDDYDSLEFNPEELSAILQDLVNLTATNVILTLIFNLDIELFSISPLPNNLIGNNETWIFERLKDGESILFEIEILVTGEGVIPIVLEESSLSYQPVNNAPRTEPVTSHDIEIIVIPPIDSIFDCLRQMIRDLKLNKGLTIALMVKLENAYQDYVLENFEEAIQHLQTLANHIKALTNPGKISLSDADALITKIKNLQHLFGL